MNTAATIPHVLDEATLGELEQGVRGQFVRPEVDGYDEARAIESAANRLDATPRRMGARPADPRRPGTGGERPRTRPRGCGHSGIINILRHIRGLAGADRIHAVLGGFHLAGTAFEPIIGLTCDALNEFSPGFPVRAHCDGRRATHELAARLPAALIPNGVGTRFEFAATDA